MADPNASIVAVTGASGLVGGALVAALAADPRFVCRAGYRTEQRAPAGAEAWTTGDLTAHPNLGLLNGADTVVHTVARTHVVADRAVNPLAAFERLNVDATLSLARAAAAAKVRRLVFLSSVKVNGEITPVDRPFRETDAPAPEDAYGITKWEAEQRLAAVARQTGLEVVTLRLPLVYGPGAKGNLARLAGLVRAGLPLPFGAVRNSRSMIGLDNLCSAVVTAINSPALAGGTFLLSDQHDLSTPDLLRTLAASLGRKAILVPVPVPLLQAAAGLAGRAGDIRRLTASLCVDSTAYSRATGWRPQVPPAIGLAAMIRSAKA